MKGKVGMQFPEENRFCELCHHFILPLCKENCILCSKSQYICPEIVSRHSHHHQFSVKMFTLSMGVFQKLTKIVRLKERNISELIRYFGFLTKFKLPLANYKALHDYGSSIIWKICLRISHLTVLFLNRLEKLTLKNADLRVSL